MLKGNEFSMYGSLLDKWYNFFYINNYIFILPLFCALMSLINYKETNRYLNVFIIHGFLFNFYISIFVSFNYILPALTCFILFTINYVSLGHNLETKNKKILALSLSILVLITNLILLKTDDYKTLVTDYNKRLEALSP